MESSPKFLLNSYIVLLSVKKNKLYNEPDNVMLGCWYNLIVNNAELLKIFGAGIKFQN